MYVLNILALKECRTNIMKKLEACKFERACREILNRYSIQNLTLEANFSLVSKNLKKKLFLFFKNII